ncbi:hypothetical protein ABE073_04680 [Lederbergia citrisecunda]|uniref:hypothetical protein n=1 Tax=Lederbergia citrisecunda TaxID=2833583 RepID=UPI003D2D47D7
MGDYAEINFANGWKIAISNDGNVLVSLVNPYGYIITDKILSDEQTKELLNVVK